MRSIERESDDIVAAAEIDVRVAARAYEDILTAVDHVGGGRRVDAGSGAETPQFLAVGRIIGGELSVAFARENEAACGGENAADHRFWRLDLPFDLAGVVVNGGDFGRLRLARGRGESAAPPPLSVWVLWALHSASHWLMRI